MALSVNEQKQLQLDSQSKLAHAKTPLEKLRYTCLSRGASGINGLGRQFRVVDDDGNKSLSLQEFEKGCHDFKVGLTKEEIDELFAGIDRDGSGSINFDEFLEALRPPMSENRKKLVDLVFKKMDKTGDGVITVDDLKGVYDVRSHPKYLNGELSERDVLNEYLKAFESRGEVDGKTYFTCSEFKDVLVCLFLSTNNSYGFCSSICFKVTWQEFLNYYSGVSSSIDDDVYFDLMLRNAYKL
ncbi:unnamed protein product [Hydatigera taeniaeformis]|uniref:Calcyphosin-like protein n=1 Tax=Hydatigena taeniaeformis TaxID=6205 RepID=A0A0R3X1B3_HYDTA|nr:unnamed protein product [Hydatigera taeniaeformis]